MSDTVWIVAQVKTFSPDGWALAWDLGGVFTTEDAARAQCTEPSDAMWSVELDVPLGRETVEPPDISYPAAPRAG
ncbi:hypothetical protein GCM10010275_30090 [Streptomyces litmocidini]|uniref:hypothetical protein n=1 Tax=Streptomyces litmocidini TaxID=67318 RepID=UPI00167E3DD0|nr:hypothetical protein [Streptomyces litmocidini]GGU91040.1 hypothetical protein GCM10010275_30090 [Streptomyces litmocidini]